MKTRILLPLFTFLVATLTLQGKQTDFVLQAGQKVRIACSSSEAPVVQTALELLRCDLQTVLSAQSHVNEKEGVILVGTLGQSKLLEKINLDTSVLSGKKQAFLLTVSSKGQLLVVGSDSHGTAYGLIEISRLLGVSPWEWWADVTPDKRATFHLSSGFRTMQFPSVEYRGIFINDEDWGLMPWSSQTYEPSEVKGEIGPRTNERIFELLLRLRANTYWPAMHECTVPFFMTKGNREMAKKYGIFMGSSHCEPMACNAAGEWKRRGEGAYDYVNNSSSVYQFWENRVKEVAGQEILYTLGMRGVHDGKMQGAKTIAEQKSVLDRVFTDQRGLLAKYINKDVAQVPQVFIPYKEVLDIYHAGLKVPEDVTLMWCDDNYGYIRHFPTAEERARKGGNGIYYHISYWGRPHDYLWLSSMSPWLIYQQMKLAYEQGIQKMWVLNVGDIKPAEYQIELFMDMAWNLDQVSSEGVASHLNKWLERELGSSCASAVFPAMKEHYRLAYICKPEFLGNTRTEEKDPLFRVVKDMPWSERTIENRLEAYSLLSETVEHAASRVPANKQSAYFELVKYPVQAAAQMNRKLLYAQLARHQKADWALSDLAYDSIVALTQHYNALEGGKWNRMMDFKPRNLPVFSRVERKVASAPMLADRKPIYIWSGVDAQKGDPVLCEGLGYEEKATKLKKNDTLTFTFPHWATDSLELDIRLLPMHPIGGDQLRFTVSLDGATPEVIAYETQGRSEEWKENVLRNQAVRKLRLAVPQKGSHQIQIKALDEGVILDQMLLYEMP